MVEHKAGNYTIVATFEPEDTLELIASRMSCDVYDLIKLMNHLSDKCWSGEQVYWSEDEDETIKPQTDNTNDAFIILKKAQTEVEYYPGERIRYATDASLTINSEAKIYEDIAKLWRKATRK